jgi:hypothetical protein
MGAFALQKKEAGALLGGFHRRSILRTVVPSKWAIQVPALEPSALLAQAKTQIPLSSRIKCNTVQRCCDGKKKL